MNEFYADGECKECGKEILLGYFRCQDCYEKGDIDEPARAREFACLVSSEMWEWQLRWAEVTNEEFLGLLTEVRKRLREGRDDG